MTSNIDDEDKGVLYLNYITVETLIKSGYRVKLDVDGSDIQLTRKGQTIVWNSYKSLEASKSTKINVTLKAGHTVAGVSLRKEETVVVINVENAVQRFLLSMQPEISESENAIFRQQPVTVTAWFRSPPTMESIRSTLQNLQEVMAEFRHIVGDSTQKHLDTVIKYGVAFSELDPRSKAAFSVLSVTFELLKQQKQRDQTVSDLARQLKRILPFAKETLKDAVEDNTGILRNATGRLYTLVIDIAEFSCDYVKRNRFKRLAKSMVSTQDQDRISQLASRLNELVEDFDRAINVQVLKSVRQLEAKMILERLQPIQAGYKLDYGCMEGTRVALLDEIVEWALHPRNGSASSSCTNNTNVYWLYGIPGIGKTTMAHSICTRLHKERRLGGAFFCRRDDQELGDPKFVLPTLIFKLAEMWGAYRKVVADKLDEDPNLTRHTADKHLLSQLLESLNNHPPHSLVLVIDALDECGDDRGRRSIISSLFDASSRVDWLRVVITSRQDSDIEDCFKQFDGRYSAKDVAADTKALQDIHFFTRSKLHSVANRCGLPEDWPGDDKRSEIVERSGGLFIFVETLSQLLEEGLDADEYLTETLSVGSGNALERLYNLYTTAIHSKVGHSKEAFRSAMATIIVVGQHKPLSDEAVARLAGLRVNVVTTLVNKLGSLLYRDARTNGGIRVRHLSIIDFLTGSSPPDDLKIDIMQANRDVGTACLKVMTHELQFNICGIESSFMSNRDIIDLESRIDRSMSAALQYSCLHWSNHLSHIPDTRDEAVITALDEFTKAPRLLYWIEALSVMGKVPAGDSILRQVPLWLKWSEKSVEQRIEDALKFLFAFRDPIIKSAPHIYISGLAFTPTETDLWRNASKSFRNLLVVERGRMQSWPARPSALLGHKDDVWCVAFSPDSRRIVSGSSDKTVRIWDVETGAAVGNPLEGHTDYIYSVAYSPNGRQIISGSRDMTIRIWEAETGTAVGQPWKGHTGWIRSVAYSPNGRHIISSSDDKTIRRWDAETGVGVGKPLEGHSDAARSVAYSPDGRHIISGSMDATIRIWDAETGDLVGAPLEGHFSGISCVAYSPDGLRIVSGSYDKTIRIWDAQNGTAIGKPLGGYSGGIWSVAYSPDGCRIISSFAGRTIHSWDAETGDPIGDPLEGHIGSVFSVAYSPNGRLVISSSSDRTIRIWDAETGASVGGSLERHSSGITSVAYSPDGCRIISGSSDTTIRIWDAATGAPVGELLEGDTGQVHSIAYSPDGHHIISGYSDTTLRIWDAKTGDLVGEPVGGHAGCIYSVVYSPDGQHIISGSDDNTIRIWDAKTGATIGKPLEGHGFWVSSVAYSPDGHHIISGSYDNTVCIWNLETRAIVGEPLEGHTGSIHSVAYSPNGLHFVSGSRDRTIRIWDAKTGAAIGRPLEGHGGDVFSVVYSPDGRHIISCSSDQTIRVWDAETGDAVGKPLEGHTRGVISVSSSPDGRYIISGSADMTIRIWDTAVLRGVDNTVGLDPDSSGWVRSQDDGLLFWVPEDCRNGLTCPAVLTIPTTGRHRVVRLDLSQFSYGPLWTAIKAADL